MTLNSVIKSLYLPRNTTLDSLMRKHSTIILTILCSAALFSCVNKDYDIKAIENADTEITFGGKEFAMPIGSFSPITLGRFLKADDMLNIVEGRYEFSYSSSEVVSVPPIAPISITPAIPPTDPMTVDFSEVSIDDINLPRVDVSDGNSINIPASNSGTASIPLAIQGTEPIRIGYVFSDDVDKINWVSLGKTSSGKGELMNLSFSVPANPAINNQTIVLNTFSMTFPYGFELALADDNTNYSATLSSDKKTISINTKAVNTSKTLDFYVKKITFDPSKDQTVSGNLDYAGDIIYNVNCTVGGTYNGTAGAAALSFSVDKQLTLFDGSFNTTKILSPIPQSKTTVGVNNALDAKEIKSISAIELSAPCTLSINVSLRGVPAPLNGVTLKDYTIQFPDFMVFQDAALNATKKLVLNDFISTAEGLNKKIEIVGFKFKENPVKNGNIAFAGDVTMQGACTTAPVTILSSQITNIDLVPSVTIDPVEVGTISGIINPELNIKPAEITISLDSNLDFMKESVLDLTMVAVIINAVNPTGISSEIDLTINPYDQNNKLVEAAVVKQPTGIIVGPNTTSKVWLSNTEQGKPEGYIFVKNDNINNLFRVLPSRLEMLMKPKTDAYESHVAIGEQASKMELTYEMVAPLRPGPDFKLVYSERAKDIGSSLKDILSSITTLNISINAANSIPLDLALSAKAYGANGQPIDVSIVTDGVVKAGTKDGAAVSSTIELEITERKAGELAKLDQLEIMMVGQSNSTVAGAALKESQSIKVRMSAKIPGGISIKQ